MGWEIDAVYLAAAPSKLWAESRICCRGSLWRTLPPEIVLNPLLCTKKIEETAKTRYVSPYLIAMIYVNLGGAENALAKLAKAAAICDGRIVWLGVDPQFEMLHSDPRFNEILRRTGNPLSK